MAKLVQKSGYFNSSKAVRYMKYIATREGVEKLSGNGPVTQGQRELIQKLLHDFPDAEELFEYEDYRKTPTLGTASAFITMETRRVCDTLDVYLVRGDGSEQDYKYRLIEEEQALLLPKMEDYCQQHWGQSLEECCADYLAEQDQAPQGMQM